MLYIVKLIEWENDFTRLSNLMELVAYCKHKHGTYHLRRYSIFHCGFFNASYSEQSKTVALKTIKYTCAILPFMCIYSSLSLSSNMVVQKENVNIF